MRWLNRTLLAVAVAGLTMVPAQARGDHVEMEEGSVAVKGGGVEAIMSTSGIGIADPSTNTGSAMDFLVVGTYKNSIYQTYLTQTGIRFPDGSDQRSAAYSKSETDALVASLAAVESWPMVCKADVVTGVVPIYPDPPATLVCRSPQAGVPNGDIDAIDGVPGGYFFVVTDVLATCGIGENCDGVNFWLSRRNIIDGDTDKEIWDIPLSDTTPAGRKIVSLQFAGPLMILEPGDYLVGMGGLTTSGGHTVFAQVMGYLTASPERFGR